MGCERDGDRGRGRGRARGVNNGKGQGIGERKSVVGAEPGIGACAEAHPHWFPPPHLR